MMKGYLRENLGKSLLASPFNAPVRAWFLVPVFAALSAIVGSGTGIIRFESISADIAFVLPLVLFVFPSLLEEAFFRGVLIPRETLKCGYKKAAQAIGLSTFAFVVWHPLNALAFNHSAIPLFLGFPFLLIVTALGITCGYSYIVSKSIWVPVIIHWATVTVWVLFLGGSNLALEFWT